ncbi:hypothetical protein CBR_g46724 [Chara braunii]|uniref:Uncharacterized protein n=1 Tax=Chara braunii TaxID=69332 RepID=A0A388K3Y2_CHABU|nr:hypothetical protein CBR_g46724 [Chara braunii]|eukprot:GBG64768.1 hypothetical protein CBR_g46724 [Chara braunii]
MAVVLAWREIVRGEAIMCWERRHERDSYFGRELVFGPEITRRSYRFLSVDVNGKAIVDLDVALGYNNRNMSHVLVWVKKTGDCVPDEAMSAGLDIVVDIVLYFIDHLVIEHGNKLDMGAFYYTYLDPPLVRRRFFHGEIRL